MAFEETELLSGFDSKEVNHLVEKPAHRASVYQRCTRHFAPLGHFIEQVPRIIQSSKADVHIDQAVLTKVFFSEAELENVALASGAARRGPSSNTAPFHGGVLVTCEPPTTGTWRDNDILLSVVLA
ncbi:hypothetical protein TIFTF001_030951 [Ficus carica]|uniref:Uncharacterized protein n=1 Tax=Ficus carica TaxID=3494 RepID=A0AA88J0D7_FICCA|nr:hypothetical protein TIFTF001_030951 [Ficus carica]